MEDLDAFLTTLEQKLRAPFSSLELAKTVESMRRKSAHVTAADYLDRLSQVLHRTDKITQLKSIIGLLGFDPGEEHDVQADLILNQTQERADFEEWVRVISGLVQGIMFVEEGEEDPRSCRGEEARELLEKTCQRILDRVHDLERASGRDAREADPCFAPYRYALLNKDLLQRVIPETASHSHFQINEDAEILHMDAKMDAMKAQEEKDHKLVAVAQTARLSVNGKATKSTTQTPNFPGFRSSKTARAKNAVQRPKASMFLTSRKPAPTGRAVVRRKGAAQALVGKGRTVRAQAGTTAGGMRGRALQGSAKSRMKMIDIKEVQALTPKEPVEDERPKKRGRKPKRKAETAPDTKPPATKKPTPVHEVPPAKPVPLPQQEKAQQEQPPPTNHAANALASAALSAYQAQLAAAPEPAAAAAAPPHPSAHKQQDWREMLQEKSNKLSAEDRFRVQQFFVDKFNPTPDQPTYKMKLHEQRTTDSNTGQPVKETYYLELDYTTFTSRQSKKIKRY